MLPAKHNKQGLKWLFLSSVKMLSLKQGLVLIFFILFASSVQLKKLFYSTLNFDYIKGYLTS